MHHALVFSPALLSGSVSGGKYSVHAEAMEITVARASQRSRPASECCVFVSSSLVFGAAAPHAELVLLFARANEFGFVLRLDTGPL
jgi:hypothetical protein